MKEAIFEQVESKDDYYEKLLESYEPIRGKRHLTGAEREVREELRYYLYNEKKMLDSEIGDVMDMPKASVCNWRHVRELPSNKEEKPKEKPKKPRNDYPKTERELQVVREFLLIAKAAVNGSRGKNFSLDNLRVDLEQSKFD